MVLGHLREDIVDKLQKIPDFLDKVLINNLREIVPINLNIQDALNNTLGKLVPLNFNNYAKLPIQNLQNALDKVADITGKKS